MRFPSFPYTAIPFASIRPNRTIGRLTDRARKTRSRPAACVVNTFLLLSLVIFAAVNLLWLGNLQINEEVLPVFDREERVIRAHSNARTLRKYPPHRYYKLNLPRKDQPDVLTHDTDYIYGEWPTVLKARVKNRPQVPHKLAVDPIEWLPLNETISEKELLEFQKHPHAAGLVFGPLPFADGTNPSILTVHRLQQRAPQQAELLKKYHPTAHYVATACMTNSQCAWKDSAEEIRDFHVSTQEKPDTVRTLFLILDRNYHVLDQATIYLERDAGWGKKMKSAKFNEDAATGKITPVLYLPALDDARLFVHNQQVFVSYREGKGFGYETQVLNPIHFNFELSATGGSIELHPRIRASETSSFCCGRNMALMQGDEDENELKSVTWVDPVTTMTVDTTPGTKNKPPKEEKGQEQPKKKSHIHGTNAFMVDLPDSNTFLGVAHFHRPNDRNPNPYARFGHHYTHAFYSIENDQLVGLSAEFVIESAYKPNDAEIIQFASGLEYDEYHDQIVIAYGINDCEAAIMGVDLETVRGMLRPVESGKEVVDYMKPLRQ
jgi:hypothetical protein